ncbi:MAG: hypothetical protein IT181_13120 [Acidobacteria bacterium]|nr:hypothetical protein [Acidobacteriota bacterium]
MKKRFAVLAALVLGLFAFEGYALWTPEDGDTISEVVWWLADQWPVVTFFFAFLMGHWFWQRNRGA